MHKVNKVEKSKESKEIAKEVFTVEQKISSIKDTLISRQKLKFSELFLETSSKDEIITTFMALLELIKMVVQCLQLLLLLIKQLRLNSKMLVKMKSDLEQKIMLVTI